ncbi:MAG: hypothetical protein LBR30_00300, partial [Clostridioides sp.]|nr:hypothetical protein [Clostridioides sp.]
LSKKSTIKEFEKNFYKLKASWGKNSFEKSLLTLSFWLSEINKKAHNSKCENIDTLYNLKTKALREIKDFVTIRYYSPKKNYKEEFIFCNYHNAIYDKGYSVFWEFIDKYKIRSCPDCKVNRIEKYYNLYLFDVRDKKGKMQFTFHLPHSIGKDFLPDEKNLTNIKYLKDEFSIFKLNGLLKKNEHFIFEGDYLENKFENALKSFMNEKNKLDK